MKRILLALYLNVIFLSSASAQTNPLPVPGGKEPLEITADGSLEWKRNDKLFIARKNALAKQGESQVAAETLTAHYREGKGSSMDLYRVDADDQVVITSKQSTAKGDHAVYDLDTGKAVLTGQALEMRGPDQVVTARDRFEYGVRDGTLIAVGHAKILRGQDTLEGDVITARLKDDAQGKRVLDTLEAQGHVVITTPTETATSTYAIYRAADNKAELTGGVTIKRGPNVLTGDRADVDMNTNTSRIFGGDTARGASGQVHGVFYPGSEKKLEQNPPVQ